MTSKDCAIPAIAIFLSVTVSTMASLSQTTGTAAQSKANSSNQVVSEPIGPIRDIQTMRDYEQWFTYYYLYPSPNLTVKALMYAEKNGEFAQPSNFASLFAFMSQIFAENPKQLASWVQELSVMPDKHKMLVWQALEQVNTDESKQLANQLGQQFDAKIYRPPALSNFSPSPKPIEKMDLSSAVLDMLWASFFATGDQKYIERIMSALPGLRKDQYGALANQYEVQKMLTAGAAQWSLTANARQHKRVMSICLQERQKHPEWQPELDKIIARANRQP